MSTWGRKCDASPGAQFGLPFLLVFDVAADDVGDIGVLFFLFLDKGVVVVERLVHLDFFFLLDPGFRGRGLLGRAMRQNGAAARPEYHRLKACRSPPSDSQSTDQVSPVQASRRRSARGSWREARRSLQVSGAYARCSDRAPRWC